MPVESEAVEKVEKVVMAESTEEFMKRICAMVDMNYRVQADDVALLETRESLIREEVLSLVEKKTDDWTSSWAVTNVTSAIREELSVPSHISERAFFVPKPGEEYDSYSGKRHVCITQVTFDETCPEGHVFYDPGEGSEILPLFLMKYRPTPSKGESTDGQG